MLNRFGESEGKMQKKCLLMRRQYAAVAAAAAAAGRAAGIRSTSEMQRRETYDDTWAA